MQTYRMHRIIGWVGTALALISYGTFSAGISGELFLFSTGNAASLCLIYALLHDRARYAAALQGTFLIMNTVGIVRIFLS